VEVKSHVGSWVRPNPTPSAEERALRSRRHPGIVLNEGWNRATFVYWMNLYNVEYRPQRNKIMADFARYSLRSQALFLEARISCPKPSDRAGGSTRQAYIREKLKMMRMFDFIFNTNACIHKPRSYSTPEDISDDSSADFLYTLPFPFNFVFPPSTPLAQVLGCDEIDNDLLTRKSSYGFSQFLKRKLHFPRYRPVKRRCTQGLQHTPIAISDAWRSRRRTRAIRRGTWTDGTMRQNRLWAEFHWVLDGEVETDPREQRRAHEGLDIHKLR
jgi:hypothetical protein